MRACRALSPVAVLLFIGCTPDFDKVWQVKDLRVLALRAEPPEVLVTPDVLATLERTPAVQIDGLIVDPTRRVTDLVRWELWACSSEENHCQKADHVTQLVAEQRTTIGEIRHTLRLPREFLMRAIEADPFRGFGGVAVVVELVVRDDQTAFETRAAKRVVYGVTLPANKRPNSNPAIAQLTADEKPVGKTLFVKPLAQVSLRPVLASGAREKYVVQTFTGGSRELEEYPTFSYFVTRGQLSHGQTGGKPSALLENKKVEDISSTFTAPAEPGLVALWIVARDDRGGVAWHAQQVVVRE